MLFTYQEKKIAGLTIAVILGWTTILIPAGKDVDKNEPHIVEAVTLESVERTITTKPIIVVEKNEVIEEIVEVVVEEPNKEEQQYPENTYTRFFSEEEKYMLAKIAMAEAEGESIKTKVLIIMSILNRVDHEYFPNSIEEVIMQKSNGVYQYSPVIPGGRWWTTEPNEECWEAVKIVQEMEEDNSGGALYFESCRGSSWHSKNLEFLYEIDNTRFYK